jgi:putative Ca2+/H+ antiporter (TMEM165/GDT1 family)
VSLAVIAITFGLVAVAELPDKSMIATIVLASRNRPVLVLLGASVAFAAHAGVAVAAGRLLELLPHRDVEAVVAALFAGAAAYLIVSREDTAQHRGEDDAAHARSGRRVALGAFAVIAIGEFGDITQLLIANLAAHYRQPWAVFVGAVAALLAAATLAVGVGRALLHVLPLAAIRKGSGVIMAGFAAYAAVSAARG